MLLVSVPQLPLPMTVVNESRVKFEVAQVHGRVVVVVVLAGVVVVVAHGFDDGSQRSVIVLLDGPAFAWILQLPSFVPRFFVFTLTPVTFPHTELVPMALTLTFPIPPQWPEAWILFFLRSFGVQLSTGWLAHTASWKVHLLPTAVPQSMLPSVTRSEERRVG